MKYQKILFRGSQILKTNNIKSSSLDSELILSKVLKKTREEILINLNNKINKKQKNEFTFYLNKRIKKHPISQILGFKFFWKYKFHINNSTLIPRPESEHIVEQALKYIPLAKSINILDIGTGSGCLIISILKERYNCFATAIDISKEALKVAKCNAKIHHLINKINFINIDIDKINVSNYDFIISNPPYINTFDLSRLDVSVRSFEPHIALEAGIDGFREIKKLIIKSKKLLKKNGKLIFEIGKNQCMKTKKILRENGLIKEGTLQDLENVSLNHNIIQALRANKLFFKDKDYIIKNKNIVIIDDLTGRPLEGRRYGDGLHQAIEAKENVEIQKENQTLASITFQNYFRLYNRLSGMTGTALTESEEFFNIYKLIVISIPTHKNMIREDQNDQIFRTDKEKNFAILKKVQECNNKGRPILVGTTSIEKSEKISDLIKKNKINHNVLNAKLHESEAKIVADAGKINTVTIATNMAGRGTDIQLGGNKNSEKKDNNQKYS